MNLVCTIVLAIFIVSTSYAQEETFTIKEVVDTVKEVVDTVIQKKSPKDFIIANSAFFEDDNYIVSKTCSGEWGGTIKV